MTIIIGGVAFKGGVGKTFVVTNLAAKAAREGKRVVVVDADMQGNATRAMGVEDDSSFYELINGDKDFADVIQRVPDTFTGVEGCELYVVPGGERTTMLKQNPVTTGNMVQYLNALRGWADVVLIDTAPGFDDLHSGTYYASDYVILPTMTELDSVEGVEKTFDMLARAQAAWSGNVAEVFGILPNRFNNKLSGHRMNYDLLRIQHRRKHTLFDPVIESVGFTDARNNIMSIYAHVDALNGGRIGYRSDKRAAKKALTNFDEAIGEKFMTLLGEAVGV